MPFSKRTHLRSEQIVEDLSTERPGGPCVLPCPHCDKGDKLALVQITEKYQTAAANAGKDGYMVYESFAVYCDHCGAWGGAFQTKGHAIMGWNMRVQRQRKGY